MNEVTTDSQKEPNGLLLSGTVFTGLGEGKHYVGMPGYLHQFEEKLGFVPYPGTLNLRLVPGSMRLREELNRFPAISIHGFSLGQRSFGSGKCYPARVSGIRAAIVVPERTHYPGDLVEILAPAKLREALGLKDGDLVTVTVDIRL